MATIAELAQMSNNVYDGTSSKDQNIGDKSPLLAGLSDGWTVYLTSTIDEDSWDHGYFGVAYKNNATHEIVIANRGTDQKNAPLSNLLTDIKLATVGGQTQVQRDAAAFAQAVVGKVQQTTQTLPNIIETGHSLGGNEAQAALVELVQTGFVTTAQASAVVFDSPGIGIGYTLPQPASSYNVVNIYAQSDIIHLAGGTHLGVPGKNMVMLGAGPNTAPLLMTAGPLGLAGGPLVLGGLLAKYLYDSVVPAHSMGATALPYLRNIDGGGKDIGFHNWTVGSVASDLTGSLVNTALPAYAVDDSGNLQIIDPSSNVTTTVALSTDSHSVNLTFNGGSSAMAQSLASLGVVSVPLSELQQNLSAFNTAQVLYEHIVRQSNGTFDVSFLTTPDVGNSSAGNDFRVTALNPAAAYNYAIPQNSQNLVETIDNGAFGSQGSFSILAGSTTVSVGANLTAVSGEYDVWTDANGLSYTFDDVKDEMEITGILLGTGNEIDIEGFSITQSASEAAGYLGIKIQQTLDSSYGTPEAPTFPASNASKSLAPNGEQTFTLQLGAPSAAAQTIVLALSGGTASDYAISTGADLLYFADGRVGVVVPAGQETLQLALVNTADPGASQTLQLAATLLAADGTIAAEGRTVLNFGYTEAPPRSDATNVIVGRAEPDSPITDYTGTNHTSNDLVLTGDGPNLIHLYDGNDSVAGGLGNDTIVSGNGNSTITGGGGQDEVLSGDGDNDIYAGSVVRLTDAIDAARSGAATGDQGSLIAAGSGNNLIVGGNGNDLIIVGQGNNVIVGGPGNETIFGGRVVTDESPTWSSVANGDYGVHTTGLTDVDPQYTNSDARYQGNAWDVYQDPATGQWYGLEAGTGNDTIYGGKGDSVMLLSNGDNYVDAGGGNDSIAGGMGRDTIFGSSGNVTVRGGGGDTYINGETGNDYLVGEGGNNTIFGGSGNDTIFAGDDQFTAASGKTWDTSATGDNYVDAGSGNSEIWGSGGNDTLIGGSGDVTIYGGAGNELISGGSGDDSINGGSGRDTIYAGGDGTDTIFAGTGETTIYGGGGTDYIQGGSGRNLLDAGDGGTADAATTVRAGSGDTTILGGFGVDFLAGGTGTNVIYAGDGGTGDARTSVQAGSGSTTIYGGTGVDDLQGGSGQDVIYAGEGGTADAVTYVLAGSGDTTIYGGGGTQQIQAGSGNTTIIAGGGDETLLGGTGATKFVISADAGNIVISNNHSTLSADIIEFDDSVDTDDLTITAAINQDGRPALVINGDVNVTLIGESAGLNLEFDAGGAAFGSFVVDDVGDTITTKLDPSSGARSEIWAKVDGSRGTDEVAADGSSLGSSYFANGSTSRYTDDGHGNRISDTFDAQGNLIADSWNSSDGSSGSDTFAAGAGPIASHDAGVFVRGNTVEASVSYTLPDGYTTLTMIGSDDVTAVGNDLDDVITGNSGNDILQAGDGGLTTLVSGSGIDTLIGGYGSDTFIVNNSADVIEAKPYYDSKVFSSVDYVMPTGVTSLTLTGSANLHATGNGAYGVTLTGNAGNDTLIAGNGGSTTLIAGSGATTLVGGTTGYDTFVINRVADVIQTHAGAFNTVQTSVSYSADANVNAISGVGSNGVVLTGSSTTSAITGNDGNDTIIAASRQGYVALTGGAGKTNFVLGSAYTANIAAKSVGNALSFGAGITARSMTVSVTSGNSTPSLVLTEHETSVTIAGGLNGTINEFNFSDGTTDTLDQLLAQANPNVSTAHGTNGNFVLGIGNGTTLTGSAGQDTLVGFGNNDTLVAGTGGDLIVAHGNDAVLVGGTGSDTLQGGSGDTTFIAGTGATVMMGGSGSDSYDLTSGGFTTLRSTTNAGIETIWLPTGSTISDYTAARVSNDLVLQSSTDGTTAIVKNYYSTQPDPTKWIIASDSDAPQFISDFLADNHTGSSTSYNDSIVAAKTTFSAELLANRSGLAGLYLTEAYAALQDLSLNSGYYYSSSYYGYGANNQFGSSQYGKPTGPENVSWQTKFTFAGVATKSTYISGGQYYVTVPAEVDDANLHEYTTSVTKTVPVYAVQNATKTIQITGADAIQKFLSSANPSNHIIPVPGGYQTEFIESSSPSATGHDSASHDLVEIDLVKQTSSRVVQTGTKTVVETEYSYTTDASSGFTVEQITTDDSNVTIIGSPGFGGIITLGNGNDAVYLPDASPPLSSPDSVAKALGAFIQAGSGNDTLHAGYGANTFAAGLGFDVITGGGLSSVDQEYGGPVDESTAYPDTIYVPLSGYATEDISISNVEFGVLNKNTNAIDYNDAAANKVIIPDGVTASDIKYRIIPGDSSAVYTLQLSYGNSNVLIHYAKSEVASEAPDAAFGGSSDYSPYEVVTGIQEFVFSDGTTTTLSGLLAQAMPMSADVAPTLQAPGGRLTVETSQNYNVSDLARSLVTSGNALWYRVSAYDTGNGDSDGSTFFEIAGVKQKNSFVVSAAQLDNLEYVMGPNALTNFVTISAFDGALWSDPISFDVSSVGSYAGTETGGNGGSGYLSGTPGNDTLTGSPGKESLDGGAGDDVLTGGEGDDVYIFGRGYGQDTIADDGNGSSNDSVRIQTGVTPEQLVARKAGNDLVLSIADTSDTLTVQSYFTDANDGRDYPIGQIAFSDGTVWTQEKIRDQTLTGSSADDALTGYQSNDTLVGGGGNDTLNGGSGDDVIYGGVAPTSVVVNAASELINGVGAQIELWVDGVKVGQAEVDSDVSQDYDFLVAVPIGTAAKVDVVYAGGSSADGTGQSLTVNSVAVGSQAMLSTDTGVVLDRGAGDAAFDGQDTLPGQASLSSSGALRYTFAPVTIGVPGNDLIIGGDGNDTLFGGEGNDTFMAGSGNNQMIDVSANSNDVYRFGIGDDGQHVISDAGGNADRIEVTHPYVAPEMLWFSRTGDDLDISVIGTPDDVLIKNWYVGTSHQIESIVLAGGQTLLAPDVQKLVDAMASFSPPSAGQSQLTPQESSALQPVLAANWH